MVVGAEGATARRPAVEVEAVAEEASTTTSKEGARIVPQPATRKEGLATARKAGAVAEGGTTATKAPALGSQLARETAMKAGAVAEGRITAAKAPALGSQLARETARKQMPAAVEALEATPSKQESALEARAISPCSKRRAASGMVPQGMMQAFPSRMESGRRPTAGGKSGRTARKEMPALE